MDKRRQTVHMPIKIRTGKLLTDGKMGCIAEICFTILAMVFGIQLCGVRV